MKYAVMILGLLAAFSSRAQIHLKDFTLKRSLKQDGLQLNFTVLDEGKRGVRHHDPSKFYFWTKAQHVQSTQGASAGKLLHGTLEAFYPEKQLAFKGIYRRGLKHGKWQYWNKDGTFQRTENWRHGKQRGKQQFFDAQGELKRTEIIRGSTRKRVAADSTIIWKPFDRKIIILKDSLGVKTEVQSFKNGQFHGARKFYVKGKLDHKVRYKKGELIEKKEKKQKEKEGNDKENPEQTTSDAEKEPGKLRQLLKKWFQKDSKEKVTPDDKGRSRKEKRAERKANKQKENEQ